MDALRDFTAILLRLAGLLWQQRLGFVIWLGFYGIDIAVVLVVFVVLRTVVTRYKKA